MMKCFVAMLITLGIVQASHFRGAIITWEPTGNGIEIRVNFRISWRLTYTGFFCDESIVKSGQLIGSDNAECFSGGCDGLDGSMMYRCTDFSPAGVDDWSSGRGSFTLTPTETNLAFGYTGSGWINLQSGSGSWALRATADLTLRSDSGKINTSPTIDISPVVKLQHGCYHTIRLPAADIDGDVIRCRWASGSNECQGVCSAFPGANLDAETCIITYNAVSSVGYYVAAIQVEDFINDGSTQPLSSIPAQFLILVYSSSSGCQSIPEFVSPTPESDSCHPMNVGESFEILISVRSKERLRSISTTSAVGMIRDPPVTSSTSGMFQMSVKIHWTPVADDGDNVHSLCFSASDISGLSSEMRCIRIPVSVPGPKALTVNRLGFTKQWNITFDMEIKPSPKSVLITVFETQNDTKVHELEAHVDSPDVTFDLSRRTVTVTLDYLFGVQTQYYVNVSPGLVQGHTGCRETPSSGITDKNFWTIDINCDMPVPPENGTVETSVTTNGTYAEFSCNEGFEGTGPDRLHCLPNETWSLSDFQCNERREPIQMSIHYDNEGMRVPEGQNFVLTCSVLGSPKPSLSWMWMGHPLPEDDDVMISEDGGRLEVTNVGLKDFGYYSCVASNRFETKHKSKLVEVLPKFITRGRSCMDMVNICSLVAPAKLCGFSLYHYSCCRTCYRLKIMEPDPEECFFN